MYAHIRTRKQTPATVNMSNSPNDNNDDDDDDEYDHHHEHGGGGGSHNNLVGTAAAGSSNTTRRMSPVHNMPTSPFKKWGARHTLALLGFLGFASSYSMRVNLSIAIVQMVNTSHASSGHDGKHVGGNVTCPELVSLHHVTLDQNGGESGLVSSPDAAGRVVTSRHPKFSWTAHQQGVILGSFFWGYVALQVPGGMLANRIGGKWVFGIGMLVTALFSLVTPLAANAGIEYLVAVRVIQGLGEGVTNPSMHALLAQWLPHQERSMLGAFVYAGTQIGTVVALPISGWLLGNEQGSVLTSGWPSVFYVFGILGIVWFCFWSWFIHDSPSSHPRISVEEMLYIQGSHCNKSVVVGGGGSGRRNYSTPWRKMLTSGPVLAILVVQTGHGWGLYTMLTELPTYMDDVLHFDIKENSYLSALPYFLMWVISIVSSIYADKMRARGISTGVVRKIFNTIAHWIPAVLLVFAANTACDRTLTVALITLAIGINGAAWASFQVNHIDLSPNNAAVMMGITNGFANLCGIGAPYVAGIILNDGSSVSRWRIIFYIAAAVYFIDNVVYLFLASGETQPWDSGDSSNNRVFSDRSRGSGALHDSGISSINASDNRILLEHDDDDDREPLLEP